MSSGNCLTLEGGMHPSPHSLTTHQPQCHDVQAEPVPGNDETAEHGGKKRKRSGRRGRPSDDRTASDKPRRERANFNAAQLYALEQLFQDQQYPDGDLRLKIAERLDLNEERVQIWFQNRRAKQKRLQRDGAHQVTDENSPQNARDYSQPSSIDYIPPQLDEDMFVPSFPETNAAVATPPLHPTDLNPAPATAPFANSCQYPTTTVQSSRCDFVPFPNGVTVAGQPHHRTQQPVTHSNCQLPLANSNGVRQEVNSGEALNGIHHKVATTQGVGKFSGPKTDKSASLGQTCTDGTEPAASSGTHLGNMSQAAEPWRTANAQAGGGELLPCGRTRNAECQALRVTSLVAASSSCSQWRKHGERCRKDLCITCREKPPPNQVCTALPDGQRNELDEALYRCAVGSIIGIGSLTPQLNSCNDTCSTTLVPETASTDNNTPLKLSAVSKPTKAARENPVSAHRRQAMVRKQRQMEKEYPSSSSDSSSDSDEENQPKRRRKVTRRSDYGAPPNRICTAVPLMDRTLPLPCLTKDLSLESFLEDSAPNKHPTTRHFPSCLPSPLSAGRLSSPEPQSSASEQHGYSSSSSSDVSDYEYFLPSSTPRQSVPNESELSQGGDSSERTPAVCAQNSSTVPCTQPSVAVGKETMSLDATSNSQNGNMQNYKPYQSFMPGPGQESMQAPACTYPIRGHRHTSEEIHLNPPQCVFSSAPPPFEMQQDPASVPAIDKQAKAVNPGITLSATAENRRNQTYEILAESRFVGELCGSPVSPWSDPGLQSSFIKSTSPQQPHHGQPNDPQAFTFHGGMPVRPTGTNYTMDVNGTSARTNYVPFAPRYPNTGASINHRPPSLAGTHQENFHPIRSHYLHTSSADARPSTFDESMERHENVFSSNNGNVYNNFPPLRNIQHTPTLGTVGVPYPETHPYVNCHNDFTSHNMNTHRPANYPLAHPPLNRYHPSISNMTQPWTAHLNHHLPFDGFSSHY